MQFKKLLIRITQRLSSNLFYLVFGLLILGFTTSAFAAPENACQLTNDSGKVDMTEWTTCVLVHSSTDAATKVIFGDEYGVEGLIQGEAPPIGGSIESLYTSVQQDGRMPGGLAGMIAVLSQGMEEEPPVPTDLALFINDITDDTMFGNTAYAQGLSKPAPFFERASFGGWKIIRNIALLISGVVLAVAALSIIFKTKINPQVVVTVYNVLPYVPIGLLLIILSYPLVTIATNLLNPLHDLAFSLSREIITEMGTVNWTGTFYALITLFFIGLVAAPVTGISTFIVILILVIAVVAIVLWLMIALEYVKTMVNFIMLVFAAPLVGLFSMMPGKQGILKIFFMRLLANLLVWPIVYFVARIGLGVAASSGIFQITGAADFVSGYVAFLVKVTVGLSIVFSATKVRETVHNIFGVQGSMFTELLGGGGQQQQRR